MLSELSASAYQEWLQFAEVEPFGPAAWDARIGWVLAKLINALTGERTQPADFVPKWMAAERQPWQQMRATLHAWRDAHADHRKNPRHPSR